MKRLSVLLALLVLFGTLTVGTGTVSADFSDTTQWSVVYAQGSSYSLTLSPTVHVLEFVVASSEAIWAYDMNTTTRIKYELTIDLQDGASSYKGAGFGVLVTLNSGTTVAVEYEYDPYNKMTVHGIADEERYITWNAEWGNSYSGTIDVIQLLNENGINVTADEISNVKFFVHLYYYLSASAPNRVYLYLDKLQSATADVQFTLKDALTGQSLTGVTVKENGTVLGTIDDGGTLELAKGTHTLTFEKDDYWSVTKTIDVQSDMTVSVEMYPSSAAFKFENFPSEIKVPENTIYELQFTLSPISTQATYNTYLSISGLQNVLEVRKDGQAISPEGGKYYLGDISGDTQVSIKFKAGAVGTHGFTLTLTSNDAIMSKTYTTTKSVTYQVEPLPFSVQMPSEWQVGTNELRISESSGQSYLITAVLKDSQGNEVWSDSYAFSPYEAHTFQVKVPSEGSYTLELQFNGQTAVYDITVNPAISLKTKTLTVEKGGEGTIVLHFKNPSSDVQYYTIKVSGGFLPREINQSLSVAPLTEKDVSIAFAVPEKLTYDAYELQVQVLQGDSVVFQDKVAVSISDSSGFSIFGGGSSGSTWLWIIGGLLIVGLGIWALQRR